MSSAIRLGTGSTALDLRKTIKRSVDAPKKLLGSLFAHEIEEID
jgi:hypothetical protein